MKTAINRGASALVYSSFHSTLGTIISTITHLAVHIPLMYPLEKVMSLYTGWSRKNGTTLSVNYKVVVYTNLIDFYITG